MALCRCDFFSDVLGMSVSMDVILPQHARRQIGMAGGGAGSRRPVLYLLHGLSDDHTIWQRRTSIERYAAKYALTVIMPNAHRSFYADMARGYRYWTFISDELPSITRSFFSVSARREDTFAAGLSMGGYGALKLALRCPDRFAAGISLSGVLDIASRHADPDARYREDLDLAFGAEVPLAGTPDDLFALASSLRGGAKPAPRLYACCGTEDSLYADNLRFIEHARMIGLDITWEQGAGRHEWGYWDAMIQRALAWAMEPDCPPDPRQPTYPLPRSW